MVEKYYLITFWYDGKYKLPQFAEAIPSFHYDIVTDIEAWVEKMQEYDECYVLVNQLEVSKEFAEKWDGGLRSM